MDFASYRKFKGTVADFCNLIEKILTNPEREDRSHLEEHYNRDLNFIRDEGYPLSIFLLKGLLNVSKVEIPKNKNSNYDAYIYLNDGTSFPIEITQIKDGMLERYRAEYLDLHGYAGLTGVSTQGFFHAIENNDEYWGEAVEKREIISSIVSRISDSVSKKRCKSYPEGTILLVVIDVDFRVDTFQEIANQLHFSITTPFHSIYLVSSNTKEACLISN